jgi:hypothetical protein
MPRNRTIFCAVVAALACACGGSKKEARTAKRSLYDAEFAIVFSAALEATRELYPNLNDNPGPGKIATAWHQVLFAGNSDDSDMMNRQSLAPGTMGNPGMGSPSGGAGMPTRLATKRYYIRFDVSVIGGRPWKVKVNGHASEWDPGAAMPVEMHGANRPPWLDPRIDQLNVAIYKRIKQYAKQMPDDEEAKPSEDELPKTDPATFTGVPAPAAKRLAEVKDTLAKRDYAALRPLLADDIAWSLGGGSGADAAMAMWQADPAAFDAMSAAIAAGCGSDGAARVRCPAGQPVAGQFQLVLEPRDKAWQVTSFVKAE